MGLPTFYLRVSELEGVEYECMLTFSDLHEDISDYSYMFVVATTEDHDVWLFFLATSL